MNHSGWGWMLGAVAVLGLAGGSLAFGFSLMPTSAVMMQRLGTLAPWRITWGMIWVTALVGLGLAVFLLATGMSRMKRSDD